MPRDNLPQATSQYLYYCNDGEEEDIPRFHFWELVDKVRDQCFYDARECVAKDWKTLPADSLYKLCFNKPLPHSPYLLSLKRGGE